MGGGAVHAIQGTLIQAAVTAAISVPLGIFTAIYLVEYGRGRLARAFLGMRIRRHAGGEQQGKRQ